MTALTLEVGKTYVCRDDPMNVTSEKVCERFGQGESSARKALSDYLHLWPNGIFKVQTVPGARGHEYAIVQQIGTKDTHRH